MHRRECLKIGGMGLTVGFAGCTGDSEGGEATSAPTGTPEPYELPEGASKDGLTDFIALFESTVEGAVKNTAQVKSIFQPEEGEPTVEVVRVGSDAIRLRTERPQETRDGYVDATAETMYFRTERAGDVTYDDQSEYLSTGNVLKNTFSNQMFVKFNSVEKFNYELSAEVTYDGRSAGLFESTGLSQDGKESFDSGESDLVIGRTGWIFSYSYAVEHSEGSPEYKLEFSGIGETTVTDPDWLDEAKAHT